MKEKRHTKIHKQGFTLVEIIVVFGLVLTFMFLVSGSLFSGQRFTSLSEEALGLMRIIRQVQFAAMQGKTATGGEIVDYSIRFETDRYIVFPGVVYDSGNAGNIVYALPQTMQFDNVEFPDQTLTFARVSGSVRDYAEIADSVELTDTSIARSIEVRVNRFGTVFQAEY